MISRLFQNFAAPDGPHIAIAPEAITTIGPFTITNSHILGWVGAALVAYMLFYAAKRVSLKSTGGFTQFIELGVEFVVYLLSSALRSRKKAYKYAPFFAAIFFFILFNNWLGFAPGVGTSIAVGEGGEIPLFRAFTADLNGTIVLALTGVILVQIIAVKEMGGMNHLKHYFGGNFKNPINVFVGILEMFGELTRVASLSLRLFFNVLIGEILIAIFSFLGQWGSPLTVLPFIIFELLVGFIQAYIFTMLCATYLGIATAHDHHEEPHTPEEQNAAPVAANAGVRV